MIRETEPYDEPPVRMQFSLRSLLVLMTVSALVLLPARTVLANPAFAGLVGAWLIAMATYFVIRGPFIARRLLSLRRQRRELQRERQAILASARERSSGERTAR